MLKIILLLLIAVNAIDYILPEVSLKEPYKYPEEYIMPITSNIDCSKIPCTEIAPGVHMPMMGMGT